MREKPWPADDVGRGSPTLGLIVKLARQRVGLTQAELAEAAGIDPGFLSKIENGQRGPSIETLARLALALNRLNGPGWDMAQAVLTHIYRRSVGFRE